MATLFFPRKIPDSVTQEFSIDPHQFHDLSYSTMTKPGYAPGRDALKRFKIEKKKDLIKKLNVVQVFRTDQSCDDCSEVIAHYYRGNCLAIRGKDIDSIFSYLEANPNHENNNYARLKKLAVGNEFGDDITEVQEAIRWWEYHLERAQRDV